MARPTKYNPKYHDPWIKGLARRGCTMEQIAAELCVAPSTVKKWVSENPELKKAVDHGRLLADVQVEDSLFRRATGYKFTKRKTVKEGEKIIKTETTEEEVPPDTTACIFWLKNRDPERWRDKQELALSDNEWVKALEESVDEAGR